MTWDQVQLFAEKAGDRLAGEVVSDANVMTMAIGAAFGDSKPLKELARDLGVNVPRGRKRKAAGADDGGFGEMVSQVSSFGGVRVKKSGGAHGADSRGAGGRARAANKRVPRPARPR